MERAGGRKNKGLNCRKVVVPPVELTCVWAQILAIFRDSEPMGLELPLAHLGLVSFSGLTVVRSGDSRNEFQSHRSNNQ